MQIDQTQTQITIHQPVYTKKILNRFNFAGLPPARIPVKPSVKLIKSNTDNIDTARRKLYLEKFGSLNYLPTITRPDLAYAMSICGRHIANPTQEHINALDNIYAYLKATPETSISYTKQEPVIQGYVDAD